MADAIKDANVRLQGKVRILTDLREAQKSEIPSGSQIWKLLAAGVKVRVASRRMHKKFCIIDDRIVVNGT